MMIAALFVETNGCYFVLSPSADLLAALKKYGCHEIGCAVHRSMNNGCDCGLLTVIRNAGGEG